MNKAILLVLLCFITIQFLQAQKLPLPAGYTIKDTISGDLDKDGVKELVVAYNTKPQGDDEFESIPRELIIYKQKNGNWTVWKRSMQALYGSRDGGMMGDPFGGITIQNGLLLITHDGGSSWKWGHTDKYRYQNGEFYLIGYTSGYGKICEYWEQVDFNLSTGKMMVKKEYEECENEEQKIYKTENETFFEKGLKITLQNRRVKEIKIVTPKYKLEIYIAIKEEDD